MMNAPLLWNPWTKSSEVRNRRCQFPTKYTLVQQKIASIKDLDNTWLAADNSRGRTVDTKIFEVLWTSSAAVSTVDDVRSSDIVASSDTVAAVKDSLMSGVVVMVISGWFAGVCAVEISGLVLIIAVTKEIRSSDNVDMEWCENLKQLKDCIRNTTAVYNPRQNSVRKIFFLTTVSWPGKIPGYQIFYFH